jgi:hypothetical protein
MLWVDAISIISSYREYKFKINFTENGFIGTNTFEYIYKCLSLKSHDENIQMKVQLLIQF